jgi:hypothetical protein
VDDHPPNLLALEAVLAPLGARWVRADSGTEALAPLSLSQRRPTAARRRADFSGTWITLATCGKYAWLAERKSSFIGSPEQPTGGTSPRRSSWRPTRGQRGRGDQLTAKGLPSQIARPRC